MSMITRLLFLIAGALLAMASCKRSDDSETGVNRQIEQFQKLSCTGGTVTRFDFQGEHVFVFADSCAMNDAGYRVTNIRGEEICFLGGFAGFTKCRGANFDSAATNPVLLFKKQ